jgi:hypothetical protein
MGFLKRLVTLTGFSEPKTIGEKLDQLIVKAIRNGFEVEYDDLNARFTDCATNACYCADYAVYPPSLDGAEVWMSDRITARKHPQSPISDVPRNVVTPQYQEEGY